MGESAGGPHDPSMTDSFTGASDPTDAATDQPWYQQTDASTHAPTDEVGLGGLDAPTIPRNPEIANLPLEATTPARSVRTKEELSQMAHEFGNSPEVVEQRLAAGKERLKGFLDSKTVSNWYGTHAYKPWDKDPGNAMDRIKEHQDAFNQAVEDAKQGKMGTAKLLHGQASGDVTFPDNARPMVEEINALRGYSADFHGLVEAGRRGQAETVAIADRADEASLLKAMAIGQNHTVGIIDKTTGDKSFIAPLVGDDRQPTGMWIHIESGAFDTKNYNPHQGNIFMATLLVPPYGETPVFSEELRQQSLQPLHDKVTTFKQYMNTGVAEGINPSRGQEGVVYTDKEPAVRLQSEKDASGNLVHVAETTVASHANIVAGSEHFSVSWGNDGLAVLTNDDLHRHAWSELRDLNLELPHEEQRTIQTRTIRELVDELASVTLEMGQPVVIGRSVEGPRLNGDENLSRNHFSVELQVDGTVKITDLGSANGTTVDNDELRQKARLITEVPAFDAPVEPTASVASEEQSRRKGFLRRKR